MRRLALIVVVVGWASMLGAALAADSGGAAGPATMLQRMAADAQKEAERHAALLADDGVSAFLQAVTDRLWAVAGSQLPPVTVKVIKDPAPQAFTYPNGVIYLSTGMLEQISNEDQLAMVLAHEMVHYTRRHAQSAFQRLQPPAAGYSQATDTVPELDPGGRELSDLCVAAERQADREGLTLMAAAGYCPSESLALVDALQPAAAGAGSRRTADGRPAPASTERRQRLQRMLGAMGGVGNCRVPAGRRDRYRHFQAPALLADAQTFEQRGHWRQAQACIERYLQVMPEDPVGHFIQGNLLRHMVPDASGAEAAYRAAIGLDRDFAPAYRELGLLHYKAGDLETARRYFETSLALAPQDRENAYIRDYLQQCVR